MLRFTALVLALVLLAPGRALAHCEVPCGIYGDAMRIEMLREHVTTIEKAMQQIAALSDEDDEDYNQIVRWVTNKEKHAEELQHIVSQYFLHQRIKPTGVADAGYVKKLVLLHEMLVEAMMTKQTLDTEHTTRLRELITEFSEAYFGPEELEHLREHGSGESR
jgi:nickel superoxide dismutase